MSITEQAAFNRACPLAATFGASQQLADGPGPNCVGSHCMAWRWRDSAQVIERRGFCGLAGYAGPEQ